MARASAEPLAPPPLSQASAPQLAQLSAPVLVGAPGHALGVHLVMVCATPEELVQVTGLPLVAAAFSGE